MKNLTRAQIDMDMEKVLAVRYTDLELEKSLCTKLLEWGKENEDIYVIAFSHTYLGDYYVAQCDIVHCAPHLMDARDIALEKGYDKLLVRIFSLLGIYYEIAADEQSSLKYYIEGLTAARRVGDAVSEGLILNNIGFSFHRHRSYEQAIQFYKQASELIQEYNDNNSPTLGIILGNLASVCVSSGHLEEAQEYTRRCETLINGSTLLEALTSQDWCQYYAAVGNAAEAKVWADHMISMENDIIDDRPNSFDIYSLAFESMMQLHDQKYCAIFLELMEKCCDENSPDQKTRLESRSISYSIAFETDSTKVHAAYRRYCVRTRELIEMSNQIITNGLKSAIQLSEVMHQREELKEETSSLKKQVNLDELTQVYTRRYFEQMMKKYESKPNAGSLGFIMIDVDCLKQYNDTYGHLEGDTVLRAVGDCLLSHVSKNIYPCRFGGDEFVCLCADLSDEAILYYVEAVRNDLNNRNIPHHTSTCAQQVTLSIGFSNEQQSSGISPHALLELADKALYRSKINGRNTYRKQAL